MTAFRAAALVLLTACGSGVPTTRHEPPRVVERTDCDQVIAHLDAVLGPEFAAGGTLPLGTETMKREVLIMLCPRYSTWMRTCLVLAHRDDTAACDAGSEPAYLSYAGPSAYQRAKFEECVAAAADRAALDQCSYYKSGDGRIPMWPDEPPGQE